MPKGNRQGPMGRGAMTGRAAGFCAGYGRPGFANPDPGSGDGMRFGRGWRAWCHGPAGAGRGWRHRFDPTGQRGWMRFGELSAPLTPTDPETEKLALKRQADALTSELDFIRKRIAEMEGEPATE